MYLGVNYHYLVYHGERARYHYLQCLQLILRMQVASLRRLWELPPEFEVSCPCSILSAILLTSR